MRPPALTHPSAAVFLGDCLDVLAEMPDNSIDAIVTDPPYGLGFMGKEWDDLPPGLPWAQECLRVLKPGGHLLAFGGTRTWHRLAVAVEDAGFEVRDSIAWLYGSGFPKSLDVSKAIDKLDASAERRARALEFTSFIRESGLTAQQIDTLTGTNMGGHYTTAASQPAVATADLFDLLRPHLPEVPERIEELVRQRTVESENFKAREVVGERTTGIGTGRGAVSYIADSDNRDVTAAFTSAAQQWQGWGTALKPAHEPVVVAMKPLDNRSLLAEINANLTRLENEWQALEADPTTPTGREGGSSAQTATSPSGSATATNLSTVSSWRACWGELCSLLSTSTTETASSTTTALRTLSSSLGKITAESMAESGTSAHGPTSIATAVGNLFASAVFGLRATLALSAAEPATGSTPPSSPAEGANHYEPIVVARKPLVGTVAANVLAHGTGALNIDASRVPASDTFGGGASGSSGFVDGYEKGSGFVTATQGRWPANVLLDGDAAAELDEQSGTTASRVGKPRGAAAGDGWGMTATGAEYADAGGASRFFPVFPGGPPSDTAPEAPNGEPTLPTFRYQAKAPTRERPTVVAEDGTKTAHPTVKPLALMRWLVRLVTPPGGTVLDTFAGSGATIEAAIEEGFYALGIEREESYLPLIQVRLDRAAAPASVDNGEGAA